MRVEGFPYHSSCHFSFLYAMKYLVVGLGNIGPEYELTRHNIGFLILDRLADLQQADFSLERHAFKTEFKHKGRTIHLIKPTTYMNASGKAVQYWMQALSINKDNVLIIADDIALPFGKLRLRPKGSDAGHNGLKDIAATLGTQDYGRLRCGIGNDFSKGRQVEYVLGQFPKDQLEALVPLMDRAGDMVLSFCSRRIQATINELKD
jgi:PTH1 family peptidyl-tRNA hydrolase